MEGLIGFAIFIFSVLILFLVVIGCIVVQILEKMSGTLESISWTLKDVVKEIGRK